MVLKMQQVSLVHSKSNIDVKYGKMAENVERILEELKEERKEYRGSIEKLVDAIIESKKTSS